MEDSRKVTEPLKLTSRYLALSMNSSQQMMNGIVFK